MTKTLYIIAVCMGLLGACTGSSASSGLNLPACGNSAPFTSALLKEGDYVAISPLGNLNPSAHTTPTDHLYFYIDQNDTQTNTKTVPLTAPGHLWITGITVSTNQTTGVTDYGINFQPCAQLLGSFAHVSALSDTISNRIGNPQDCTDYTTGGTPYHRCSYGAVALELKAGDAIGSAGGNSIIGAMDFGLYDSRVTKLVYANDSRITADANGFDDFHVVCAIDYFTSTLKTTMESYLGAYDGSAKRTATPLCGSVDQDIASTAQGVWYPTTGDTTGDRALALVHDNVDPSIAVFSVGTAVSTLSSATYSFTPSASGQVNRDFKDITADGTVYCFDGSGSFGFIILVKMPTSTTLRIEKLVFASCGDGPWDFNPDYSSFER